MKKTIYTDISVIGGCFDIEFEEGSNSIFEEFIVGSSILVISEITLEELEKAPQKVKDILKKVPQEFLEYIELPEEAKELAQTYLMEGVVSKKSLSDAQHIAIATVIRADVLISWNFKHIVNLDRIHGYNSVNFMIQGVSQLDCFLNEQPSASPFVAYMAVLSMIYFVLFIAKIALL